MKALVWHGKEDVRVDNVDDPRLQDPVDVIVHNYKTVHGAGGNLSRYQVRRAASLRYCGDDIRVCSRPWAPRQLHHTTKLNEGEPLSGPDFPVGWRRWQDQEAA